MAYTQALAHTSGFPGRTRQSGSLNGAGPHPDLMHVPRDAKPNKDSAFRPRDRKGSDEFFDPVLPDDPRPHLLRRSGGGNRQVYQLLRLEAPGLTLRKATLVNHETKPIEH